MIEVIKKKINLEEFKSRIPGLISVINQDDNFLNDGASWGKIPVLISILGRTIKYGTMMDLYYKLLDIITKSEYYKYSLKQDKWVKIGIDWRDILKNKENVRYTNNFFITENEKNEIILGITSLENVGYFYDTVVKLVGDEYNGFDFFENVNNLIGKEIVPYFYECKNCGKITIANDFKVCEKCGSKNVNEIQEPHVPYFVYLSDVQKLISFMEELQQKSDTCCNKNIYKEHGGDVFYNYLLGLKNKGVIHYNEIPTIDLPVLLTSKLYDLGVYRTYNVDIKEDDDSVIIQKPDNEIVIPDTPSVNNFEIRKNENNSKIVKTSGESKLRTLRKRKRSVDDDGQELPGIYNKNSNILELPYQINYIKNPQYKGIINSFEIFNCDTIVEMNESADSMEQTEEYYKELISILNQNEYIEGTTVSPIMIYIDKILFDSVSIEDVKYNTTITVKNDIEYEKNIKYVETESLERINGLKKKLLNILKRSYSHNIFCLKQEYEFIYNINKDYNNNKGEIISKKGVIYITYCNPRIEIIYVLGGRFKRKGDKMTINENNPFKLNENNLNNWDGEGIWYKETYPIKKHCVEEIKIDSEIKTLVYDVIDFESKEITYEYDNIDFPRKKYILCEDIIYKSEGHKENSYNDAIFKDEKMLTINYPLKENYDVVIDRGSNSAFERHLQLSELKTWEDLENYRNGMFLEK